MATMTVSMDTRRVLLGTSMRRIQKGIEHLYYLVLFSRDSAYAGKAEAWRAWLRQGLNMNVRAAPPKARDEDRYIESISYGSRSLDIRANAGNQDALARVQAIMEEIERMRSTLTGKSDEEKATTLLTNERIATTVVGPVEDAIKRAGLLPDEAAAFINLLRRALVFLVDDDVTTARQLN